MFFRSILSKVELALRQTLLPISIAFCAFQLPIYLFGTPANESPIWELIKHRHAVELREATQFDIEHFGREERVERDSGLWASGQRSIRMFVRGLSVNPGATFQNTTRGGIELIEGLAAAISDSAWGNSVRHVADSFRSRDRDR